MTTGESFRTLLKRRHSQGLFTCVGLDSEIHEVRRHIPVDRIGSDAEAAAVFNRKIIEVTHPYACAFKINTSFYEAYRYGFDQAIPLTISHCRSIAPDVPIIIDGKRGDIGNSMQGYVEMLIRLGGDALTCPPGMGEESLLPLLQHDNLEAFVLCRTSNPGAADFQEGLSFVNQSALQYFVLAKRISIIDEFESLIKQLGWELIKSKKSDGYLIPNYQLTALHIRSWNFPTKSSDWGSRQLRGNCGAVVGATATDQIRIVRQILGDDIPILIPGIGKQGGDLEASIAAGLNKQSTGILINASRSIIFAGQPGEDYARAAHDAAKLLHDNIQRAIAKAYAPN